VKTVYELLVVDLLVMELGRQGHGIGLGLFQHRRQMLNFK
jgi:hypothetical protein